MLGPPPTDHPDLQESWAGPSAAVDDVERGVLLTDSFCETFRLAVLGPAADPLQAGAQHPEKASLALERWKSSVGL